MTASTNTRRSRLSRGRVLEAALTRADVAGLDAFSMRGLAQELGVVPMALYKHVANKDELLDGMVDIVFGEIESPAIDDDWRSAMRRRAISVREAGFSFELAVHAYSVQDAYIYGFALQERDLGFTTPASAGEAAQRRAETIGALDDYPYLAEIATKLPESGYDNAVEFAWGLDLILDGLDRHRGPTRRV